MATNLDDDALQRIALLLIELHRKESLSTAISLGRLVIDELFGGDLKRWRTNTDPNLSIRKLAKLVSSARPASLSSALLHRSLHAYEMSTRLDLQGTAGVTLAHAMALKPLPQAEQRRWLARIGPDTLTVAELKEKSGQKKPTRKREKAIAAALKRLQEANAELAEGTPAERAAARELLLEAAKWATAAAKALEPAAATKPPEAVPAGIPDALPPEPEPAPVSATKQPEAPADYVLTGTYLDADAAKGPGVKPNVWHFTLAGYQAPGDLALAEIVPDAPPDIHTFMRVRWSALPDDTPEDRRTQLFPGPVLGPFLEKAEAAARHLQLRYAIGLPGLLDLCVMAELVDLRPALAERTTVALDRVARFGDALPRIRAIWSAFRAEDPEAWLELRDAASPALRPAFDRWLHELPDTESGLCASQRALLVAAREGRTLGQAVRGVVAELDRALDEAVVELNLFDLARAGLVEGPTEPTFGDYRIGYTEAQKRLVARVRLTPLGEAVLGGAPFLPRAVDRWWGGTRITSTRAWRYDRGTGKLVEP